MTRAVVRVTGIVINVEEEIEIDRYVVPSAIIPILTPRMNALAVIVEIG